MKIKASVFPPLLGPFNFTLPSSIPLPPTPCNSIKPNPCKGNSNSDSRAFGLLATQILEFVWKSLGINVQIPDSVNHYRVRKQHVTQEIDYVPIGLHRLNWE